MRIKILIVFFFQSSLAVISQIAERTHIRGFMDIGANYDVENKKVNFLLGEQDLFITSDISNRISFLGESVLKYNAASTTKFAISLERAVFKYNYFRNHSFFAGKVHTALNYWNDTYHHGRLFFPTVGRPELFNQSIIPLHTTGFGLSGENLGNIKFGYTLMGGNGLGSTDILDNNSFKAFIAACHIKPLDGLRIGASGYFDQIDGAVHDHGGGVITVDHMITQYIYSGSIAYFKNKIEFLAESSTVMNSTDSLKNKQTDAFYVYAGFRIKDIIIPYVRYDYIHYTPGEMYFTPVNTEAYTAGIRYEMNYLTSFKLEYQYKITKSSVYTNNINFQIAIGF